MNRFLITFLITSLWSLSSFAEINHFEWFINPNGLPIVVDPTQKAFAFYENETFEFPFLGEKCNPKSYENNERKHLVNDQLINFSYYCRNEVNWVCMTPISKEAINFIYNEFSKKNEVKVWDFTFSAKGFNKAVKEAEEINSKGVL